MSDRIISPILYQENPGLSEHTVDAADSVSRRDNDDDCVKSGTLETPSEIDSDSSSERSLGGTDHDMRDEKKQDSSTVGCKAKDDTEVDSGQHRPKNLDPHGVDSEVAGLMASKDVHDRVSSTEIGSDRVRIVKRRRLN